MGRPVAQAMTLLLYVDDEESIGRVVTRFFTRRGDAVVLARTIGEARAVLEAQQPDAIFIDVWLGQENGLDLLRWIDATMPFLHERVAFVSGELPDAGTGKEHAFAHGRPMIQKPFELTTLAALVDGMARRDASHAGRRVGL